MATMIIGADICPIGSNLPFFTSGDGERLFNDLLPEIRQADFSVANFECPLIKAPSPIQKTGPIFGEDDACLNGIRSAGIQVLSLANNHILDHGAAGLKNTLEACDKAGIATVGAGENLAAARRMLIRKAGNLRIGLLSVTEHEFSVASKTTWGANPLDLIDFVRNVKSRKLDFDYLVVLLHGAHEFQPITPRIQDTCRFMIEMGADAVIVQHPHSLGGYEEYLGGHIVYGQGALLMDEAIYRDVKSFHEGFLVKLRIEGSARSSMEIIPFVQSDPVPGARRMKPDREAQFRESLAERSRAIQDDAFVQNEWLEFCQQRKHGYLAGLLGFNKVFRKLNHKGLLLKFAYGKKPLLGVKNLVNCESHREAIQTIFDKHLI
jgi:hypothetical protein